MVSEVKSMSKSSERLLQATHATSDSFMQLVTHHRRFLATSFVAAPANRVSVNMPYLKASIYIGVVVGRY